MTTINSQDSDRRLQRKIRGLRQSLKNVTASGNRENGGLLIANISSKCTRFLLKSARVCSERK
jgi:hypothetical protein